MTTVNFQALWEQSKAREDGPTTDWRDAVSSGPLTFWGGTPTGVPTGKMVLEHGVTVFHPWNSKDRRRWRRRNIPNSQRAQATGGLLRWRTYVSPQGDRATVRFFENGSVYFGYIGPSGTWGLYPADTSGRSDMPLAEFLRSFPVLAEEP